VAITNEPSSALAATADRTIDLGAGPERAIAATKTYTTSLLAIARLSVAIAADDDGDLGADLDAIPDAIADTLSAEAEVERIARELSGMDRSIVVGRGFEYANAREWALKLKELARVFADPYSAADFLHGPIALAQPGIPILVLAPEGAAAAGQIELLRDLRDRGIDTVVVSDVAETRALGRWSIPIPAGLPEWLRPIVTIVPAQLFAYHLTLAKGLDAEAPRGLSKVTRTR
jgi:glucosamine--fructose-6-phosphate aminotransferase (isomerizing)